MDGQPLTQALAPAFLAAHPVTWIETYGGVRPPPDEALPSGQTPSADEAALESQHPAGPGHCERLTQAAAGLHLMHPARQGHQSRSLTA